MKSTFQFLVVLAVVSCTASMQPIPHRPPRGFQYPGSSCNAPVEFKAFVDLTCSDCKEAWPAFMQVAEYYNSDNKSLVSFETLTFPLPYHRAAFSTAQASYILNKISPENMYNWFTYIFKHQAKYQNVQVFEKTENELLQIIVDDIFEATGVKQAEILSHFMDTDPSRWNAIVMWKYACTRTAFGTPTVFINGARVDFDLTWTLDDWKKVIGPLLKDEDTPKKTCPDGELPCKYLVGKMECCTKGESCVPNVGCRC